MGRGKLRTFLESEYFPTQLVPQNGITIEELDNIVEYWQQHLIHPDALA